MIRSSQPDSVSRLGLPANVVDWDRLNLSSRGRVGGANASPIRLQRGMQKHFWPQMEQG
jgi:hypothetical protein